MKIDAYTKNLIKQELKNDIGAKDLTTEALIAKDVKTKAIITARQKGVIAGMDIAKVVFTELDKDMKFKAFVRDGDRVKSGKTIAEINGSAWAVLSAERTALNFLGHLSGIATLTREFVDRIRPYKAKIMDTRKTTPGLRNLEKYAVKCGGGINHRIGLWDGILIKDNHLAMRGENIKEAIRLAREKSANHVRIEIEVENMKQLKDALTAKADIILLDNMTIAEIEKAVQICRGGVTPPLLEASGGVNLSNARRIAKAGVDRISIGALTHSAKAFDLSLCINLN